jgi:urease accessory protein
MNAATLRLWQLISPTLPVGAYSYSQALEYVIECGTVRDEPSTLAWLRELLHHGLAALDLPVLLRVHRAWTRGDATTVAKLSRELEARRDTAELRFEDMAMGGALTQLLTNLGEPLPSDTPRLPFASAFAVACANWRIAEEDACAGFAWAWCESQVAAAVKLVPLGHTAGQRMLLVLGAEVGTAVAAGVALDDDHIGATLPGLAIASALHETQYTRLFRS